jgi:hypothetical protein
MLERHSLGMLLAHRRIPTGRDTVPYDRNLASLPCKVQAISGQQAEHLREFLETAVGLDEPIRASL